VYFIVSLRVYVCDYDRASVSGLLRPFLSFGFYPLNLHSFIHPPTFPGVICGVLPAVRSFYSRFK